MRKNYAFLCFFIILSCFWGCASPPTPNRNFDKVDVDDDGFVTGGSLVVPQNRIGAARFQSARRG